MTGGKEAMTGTLPDSGDLVHITPHADASVTVSRFRVMTAQLHPRRPGWCVLSGWDADEENRMLIEYTARIAGLTILLGDGWTE